MLDFKINKLYTKKQIIEAIAEKEDKIFMRMRKKPWARPELEMCQYYIKNPVENKEQIYKVFKKNQPIHLELGCGRGSFISKLAVKNKDINYIVIDMKSEMLAYTRRNIEKEYSEIGEEVDNVVLIAYDIERILDILTENEIIERIYINFCNPWPKPRHKKKRLTHTRQLQKYKQFLKSGAEIYFKTDDDELFKESIEYFKETGFDILKTTYDLHSEDCKDNIQTEHEKMFTDEGIRIKALIAKYIKERYL